MLGGWVEQVLVEGSSVKWQSMSFEIQYRRVGADEPLWNHRDEIGLRHHVQGLEVVWNGERHIPPAADFVKPCIHGILGELPPHHGNMLQL